MISRALIALNAVLHMGSRATGRERRGGLEEYYCGGTMMVLLWWYYDGITTVVLLQRRDAQSAAGTVVGATATSPASGQWSVPLGRLLPPSACLQSVQNLWVCLLLKTVNLVIWPACLYLHLCLSTVTHWGTYWATYWVGDTCALAALLATNAGLPLQAMQAQLGAVEEWLPGIHKVLGYIL